MVGIDQTRYAFGMAYLPQALLFSPDPEFDIFNWDYEWSCGPMDRKIPSVLAARLLRTEEFTATYAVSIVNWSLRPSKEREIAIPIDCPDVKDALKLAIHRMICEGRRLRPEDRDAMQRLKLPQDVIDGFERRLT